MRKVPEIERASEKKLVGDRHRLCVRVDGPQEAGVERSLKNHYKHKVSQIGHCVCLLEAIVTIDHSHSMSSEQWL